MLYLLRKTRSTSTCWLQQFITVQSINPTCMNDSMEASNQVPPAVLVVRMSALIMVSLPPVLMLIYSLQAIPLHNLLHLLKIAYAANIQFHVGLLSYKVCWQEYICLQNEETNQCTECFVLTLLLTFLMFAWIYEWVLITANLTYHIQEKYILHIEFNNTFNEYGNCLKILFFWTPHMTV